MRRSLLAALSLTFASIVGGCLHAPMPWSPDGKWIAYVVEVRPIDQALAPGWLFQPPSSASTSPLVPPTGYRLWASRADSGESILLEDSKWPLSAPCWSPDGRALAYGRIVGEGGEPSKFEVVVLDGPGHRRTISSRTLGGVLSGDAARLPGQAVAWSPDGRFLAVPQVNPLGLAIVRVDNGRTVNTIHDAFLPSWSSDSSRLAFYLRGTGDTLNCIDSPTGQTRFLVEIGQAGQAPIWTRDNSTLVVAARRSIPRGGDAPGDQVEMLKVRVDNAQVDTLRALTNEAVIGRNRAIEGVSVALDPEGENLFCSMVIDGMPNQITWYQPRQNAIYKRFYLVDYTVPMSSLSLSPDGRTLAARVGPIDRLSPPALCDLDNPDTRARLLAPDDDARVEWISMLVRTAQGILGTLPTASNDPNAQASGQLERLTLLPVPGEFEANQEQTFRLQRLGRLGRPLCDRPASAPEMTPEVAALLDEARLFFDYLARNYSAAFDDLGPLENRAETPDRRFRLLCLRAQIFLAKGDVDRAEQTIQYLETLDRHQARRIEWTGSEYAITGNEPRVGRGWPSYLSWRALSVRIQLHDEVEEDHVNPDNPRFNFGLGPIDQRGNVGFPNDPFLNQPVGPRSPVKRGISPMLPQAPNRERLEGRSRR